MNRGNKGKSDEKVEKSKTKYGKSTSKVRKSKKKVSEKCNKAGEKYIVVKKSALSAEGTTRDVENTPKFTRPNCILARRSSLGPPPGGRHRT